MSKQSIVLIAGFESFNTGLYRQVANLVKTRCPDLEIHAFSDRDLTTNPTAIADTLKTAQVFFASLIFDYDRVVWLRDRIQTIPIRLIFESALELMSMTQIGAFTIGDKPKGMPKPIKFILDKFNLGTKGREEDRIAGYLNFLKTGPQLLKFIPIQKVQDLRNWLIIYSYWNAGGLDNVAALFWTIAEKYLGLKIGDIPPVLETPNMGLLHPDSPSYFTSPRQYLEWYAENRRDRTASYPPHVRVKHLPDPLCIERRNSTQMLNPSDTPDIPDIPDILASSDPLDAQPPIIAILLYRKHVITKQKYIPQLIRYFEQAGLIPLPIFINGVEGHIAVRDWLTSDYEMQERQAGRIAISSLWEESVKVDAIVSTIGFTLVGGPAGSMEAGRKAEVTQEILNAKNVPYIVSAPLLIQDIHSWTRQGIGGLQSVVLYALPELDGAIDTVPLGGLVGEEIYLVPERVHRLIGRLKHWVALHRTPAAERRTAIILYGFPPGYGAVGTAALLNVPRSLLQLLHALKAQGYDVGDLPAEGEDLIRQVKEADELAYAVEGKSASVRALETWLGQLRTGWIEKQWKSLTGSGIKTYGDEFLIGGVQLGKIWIGVQPPLGIAGDPMRLMFERDLTPHPQYAAFYKWLQCEFCAHAIVHLGMHGTVEWLPGSPLGNTGYSWSDILLGDLPNLYIYAANNPSESILAKRRGYGVLISHNVPPYGRAGLYKELVALRDLIAEYREDPDKNFALKEAICKKITDTGLQADCPFPEAKRMGLEFTYENIRMFGEPTFDRYLVELYAYLQVLESRLFSSGLHVLGAVPSPELLQTYLQAYFGEELPEPVISAIANGVDRAEAESILHGAKIASQGNGDRSEQDNLSTLTARLDEAIAIRTLLAQTGDEITNLLRGLNGEYIPPAPGGDLLRDGVGVLPTGRNIHALDPYRMPSPAAYTRGQAIAQQILALHLKEHGTYPETVAVMLWGLDAIKTKGESLGILLELVGAEPVKEGTGRIVRYELRSLSDLGHPRIDVLANLSGIFRDSFGNILELLDDLFQRAAELEEPEDRNFIRKHVLALRSQGIEQASARLFSNPAGDFGSLVNDRVVDANWESATELGQTWRDRNAFSYGRQDRGKARPEVLSQLLQTTGRIVQEIDSVEYGLTDIQEYYANTGGLKQAAEIQQRSGNGNAIVQTSFVESFSKDTTPRNLEELLRMEYRTKLLNPKWAEAMASQGSGGAFEISQRMTALIGWGGTTGFRESWVYDQASDTYAIDPDMAKRLRDANPEAFRNIVGRMLEAHGRGFWHPDPDKLEQLRALYTASEDILEGLPGDYV
ncbi:magnesium chelatase subunit H [Pseudanabaena sp. PCC 6802]|uniref:magnesium chelatase subunit H n=1 Tax=Pseudanabaena sp. PCC 6802 TaxID=118173 RepID=UPI000349B7C4|nr:magnesium chelatase subunit H [Pseudanabaena sp. PCC 6802]